MKDGYYKLIHPVPNYEVVYYYIKNEVIHCVREDGTMFISSHNNSIYPSEHPFSKEQFISRLDYIGEKL